MTMTLVSTVTVGSGGAASIDFTSIPQTGTDLFVVLNGRDSGAANYDVACQVKFNSDTSSIYSMKRLQGSGSAASSSSASAEGPQYVYGVNGGGTTASTFGNLSLYIPNYAGSNKKTASVDGVSENNATAASANIAAILYDTTTAITAVSLISGQSGFAQYSTASLYTITKGSGGATVS